MQKSQALFFWRKQTERDASANAPAIYLGEEQIPYVKEVRFLGIILDKDFSFKSHASMLKDKCSRKALSLTRIAKITNLSSNGLRTIYRTYIDSQICYCPTVFLLLRQTDKDALQRIQNHALRTCYGLPRGTSVTYTHQVAELGPLEDRTMELAARWLNKALAKDIHGFGLITPRFIRPKDSHPVIALVSIHMEDALARYQEKKARKRRLRAETQPP